MKEYKKPGLKAMNMMIGCELLVNSYNGNAFSGQPQGGDGTGSSTPRSRQHSVWDTEDEDWDN